jgi:hypothetical protein
MSIQYNNQSFNTIFPADGAHNRAVGCRAVIALNHDPESCIVISFYFSLVVFGLTGIVANIS